MKDLAFSESLTQLTSLLSHDTIAVKRMALVQIERLLVKHCSEVREEKGGCACVCVCRGTQS